MLKVILNLIRWQHTLLGLLERVQFRAVHAHCSLLLRLRSFHCSNHRRAFPQVFLNSLFIKTNTTELFDRQSPWFLLG